MWWITISLQEQSMMIDDSQDNISKNLKVINNVFDIVLFKIHLFGLLSSPIIFFSKIIEIKSCDIRHFIGTLCETSSFQPIKYNLVLYSSWRVSIYERWPFFRVKGVSRNHTNFKFSVISDLSLLAGTFDGDPLDRKLYFLYFFTDLYATFCRLWVGLIITATWGKQFEWTCFLCVIPMAEPVQCIWRVCDNANLWLSAPFACVLNECICSVTELCEFVGGYFVDWDENE